MILHCNPHVNRVLLLRLEGVERGGSDLGNGSRQDMIMAEGKAHAKNAHPGFPIPENMLRNMIKGGMKQVE